MGEGMSSKLILSSMFIGLCIVSTVTQSSTSSAPKKTKAELRKEAKRQSVLDKREERYAAMSPDKEAKARQDDIEADELRARRGAGEFIATKREARTADHMESSGFNEQGGS